MITDRRGFGIRCGKQHTRIEMFTTCLKPLVEDEALAEIAGKPEKAETAIGTTGEKPASHQCEDRLVGRSDMRCGGTTNRRAQGRLARRLVTEQSFG